MRAQYCPCARLCKYAAIFAWKFYRCRCMTFFLIFTMNVSPALVTLLAALECLSHFLSFCFVFLTCSCWAIFSSLSFVLFLSLFHHYFCARVFICSYFLRFIFFLSLPRSTYVPSSSRGSRLGYLGVFSTTTTSHELTTAHLSSRFSMMLRMLVKRTYILEINEWLNFSDYCFGELLYVGVLLTQS